MSISKTEIDVKVEERLKMSFPSFGDVLYYKDEKGNQIGDDANAMSHAFMINDLLFMVPPIAITSQSEDDVFRWQSLRSKNSVKAHSGKGNTVWSVQIDLPSKQAITNVDMRDGDDKGGNNTGKRGGLLDLIIQFKNIPFARIENAYIRSQLRIPQNKNLMMCMNQMSISTVPGEPDLLRVHLLMTVFNYSPYSDRWGFKKEWQAKDEFGGLDFNDVNPIP